MSGVAVIGGSGLQRLKLLSEPSSQTCQTPYGEVSYFTGDYEGQRVVFLARHGEGHVLAPHKINYRANIWALADMGIKQVLAINAVGGIHKDFVAGHFVVPDQLIDYSHGRRSTYCDDDGAEAVVHVDFTEPYNQHLRLKLIEVLASCGLAASDFGVYACTQGPRLETAAEIQRLKRDGCDLVGMTGMPEACLARELDLEYASLCLVVNPAAGISDGLITMEEIIAVMDVGMREVEQVIAGVLRLLASRS